MIYNPTEARNARLLFIEICWSSILGGIIAFNAAYVLRLGATNTDVSLLSALPSLSAILVALPAGRFLQSRARPGRWTLLNLGLFWTGFLFLAFVPWVNIAGLSHGTLAVLILAVFTIPSTIFGIGIQPFMAEVISRHNRIRVFAVRQFINATITSMTTFFVGIWLSRTLFPGNYQTVYVLAWCCGLASLANLVQIRVPERAAPPPTAPKTSTPRPAWRLWPSDMAQNPDFMHIIFNTLFHSAGLWMATPLYILRYVRELGASDAWLGYHATVAGVSAIAGLLFWRWAAERLREPRTLRLTILTTGVFPTLVGLVPHLTPILFFDVFNGFFAAGVNLSYSTVLLISLPEDRRPEYMGLYSTILNTGAFVAPLISVALANWFGIGPTLLGCGVLAFAGAASHWIWRFPDIKTSGA